MTSLPLCFLQAAIAFSSSGRRLLVGFHFSELGEQFPVAAVQIVENGLALGFKAETALALLSVLTR